MVKHLICLKSTWLSSSAPHMVPGVISVYHHSFADWYLKIQPGIGNFSIDKQTPLLILAAVVEI